MTMRFNSIRPRNSTPSLRGTVVRGRIAFEPQGRIGDESRTNPNRGFGGVRPSLDASRNLAWPTLDVVGPNMSPCGALSPRGHGLKLSPRGLQNANRPFTGRRSVNAAVVHRFSRRCRNSGEGFGSPSSPYLDLPRFLEWFSRGADAAISARRAR